MSTQNRVSYWPRFTSLLGLVLVAAIGLAGCGGTEDNTVGYVSTPDGLVPIAINSPAQIAQESADNYDNNNNGMITGVTLKRWKDDWLNERPAGITGKLVILQVTIGDAGTEYIKPNGMNVFTYLSPTSEWIQTRTNGVISTVSMVPDGASMDGLLKKYNIDPHSDMIVVAMGNGSTGNAMGQGRIWYALRYWGVEAGHLALLNGENSWQVTNGSMVAVDDFQLDPSSAPNNGIATVKSLPADNTALQATVEDMLNILPASDTNVLNDGVFIWDARGMNQYSAGEDDGTGVPVADYMTTFQNSGSSQGHPNGALQLNFTNMLLSAEGYRYKDKADLAAYLDGNISGDGFADATYQPVGVGNAYQPGDTVYTYCETTFRAMITGVASAVILGKPTRFYDGAMVEWHSLSHLQDATGNYILPADSPWRTEVKSFFRPADDPSKVAQRQITDPYAAHANAIILADKAYKTSATDTGGGGAGGGGLPPNPCGG
jgi:3-mercaptopyruvate sulfurtransferase SseA